MDANMQFLQAWLTAEEAALTETIESLTASERKDEANLLKAARNIYGICQTLRRKADGLDGLLAHLDALRLPWQSARSLAAEHNDFARVAIEDRKLDTLDMIIQRARSLQEEVAHG